MSKIIKLPDVIDRTALSRSSIYAYIANNAFPKPIRLGLRSVGWVEKELNDWLNQRMDDRTHG